MWCVIMLRDHPLATFHSMWASKQKALEECARQAEIGGWLDDFKIVFIPENMAPQETVP